MILAGSRSENWKGAGTPRPRITCCVQMSMKVWLLDWIVPLIFWSRRWEYREDLREISILGRVQWLRLEFDWRAVSDFKPYHGNFGVSTLRPRHALNHIVTSDIFIIQPKDTRRSKLEIKVSHVQRITELPIIQDTSSSTKSTTHFQRKHTTIPTFRTTHQRLGF